VETRSFSDESSKALTVRLLSAQVKLDQGNGTPPPMKGGWFSIHLLLAGCLCLSNNDSKNPPVSAVPFFGPRLMSPEVAAAYIAVCIDVMYEMIRGGKMTLGDDMSAAEKLRSILTHGWRETPRKS
jgi:hypothetical protein